MRFLAASLYQFVAYFSMALLPRNVQHIVTIWIAIFVTIVVHVYVYQIRDNSFGTASCIMASFVRQYVISLNYYDGGVDPSKLSERQQYYALKEMPSFTDYMGYMFFSSTIVCGPFVEYRTFNDWVNLRGHFKDMPTLGQVPTLIRRFIVSVLVIGGAFVLSSYVSFDHMLTEEFAAQGFLYKAGYLILCI